MQCLFAALVLSFGSAVAFVLIGLLFAVLAGVLSGPGISATVSALIGRILVGAAIFFAAGFIQMAVLSASQSKNEPEIKALTNLANVWALAAFQSERAEAATLSVRASCDTEA